MHKPTMSALAALALSLSLAPTASAKGTVTAKVRLAKDLPNQAVDLMRPYLTSGSKLAKGDLYLQLCDDAACAKVKSSHKVVNYMFSSGFPKDVSVADLPDGTFFARFGLDTQYSQDYAGGFDAEKGFGPYDLLQSEGADPRPKLGDNLTPAAKKITIANGASVDLGEAVLGTLLTTNPAFAPGKESGWLLAAASGDGSYRNHLKALDLDTYQLAAPAIAKLDGADFKGDLCGIIPGKGSEAFVVGVGNEGAYVFSYDTKKRAFASGKPVKIPHPDCKDGKCPTQPSAVSYPWMCRGSFAEKGGKSMLFLHDYKGAGAQTTVNGYHAAVVDVTSLATGGGGLVATYGVGADPFLSPKRLFRGAGVIGDTLYLLEPSWSKALADDKAPRKNHVYAIPIQADGKLDFAARKSFTAEASDDTCGATNNAVPGLTIQAFGGGPKLFVGNDDAITIHDPSGKQTGSIDTRNYGTLVTSFALAPDGKTLYGMPNCKSRTAKAKLLQGVSTTKRATLDRHAVVVLDLKSSGTAPAFAATARDFDEDGANDGGVDLEYLYLKRDLLRWCETCTGVVPPTVYTGPEIAVGQKGLFLRGSAIQGDGSKSISSSGLGQVGDLGVYDLGSGRGVMFRDYKLVFDGPSSRWGFDLNPKTTSKLPNDDVSVAALLYVKK